MNRGTRMISRMQLSPELLERLSPPLRAADQYNRAPDIVFYTGCNIIKTPHIALLVLEVLDALGVTYEVMGGVATCCGIQQFKQGDAKTAGRVAYNTIERLARPGASRVISWCPSCQIQVGEFALPAYKESFGTTPFDLNPIAEFLAERLDDLRPLFVHPVNKRVALQERAALPGVAAFYARWYPMLWLRGLAAPGRFAEFGPLARHLRFVERSARRLARASFHGMLLYRARMERKQAFLFRSVDIVMELFAMTAAITHAARLADGRYPEAERARELTELFCRGAERKVRRLFADLWENDDAMKNRLAAAVMEGHHAWLQRGILESGLPPAAFRPRPFLAAAASPESQPVQATRG